MVFGNTLPSTALPRNIDDDVNAAQQELESASALVREVAAELAEIRKQLPIAEAKLKKAREELAAAKEKDRLAAEKLAELENQLQITQKNYDDTNLRNWKINFKSHRKIMMTQEATLQMWHVVFIKKVH